MQARTLALAMLLVAGACGGDDLAPVDAALTDSSTPRPAVLDSACAGSGGPRVLVFSRETLWMHPSTPVAAAALAAMCETEGFAVTTSRDEAVFDGARLGAFGAVVFAVTSGIVLDDPGRGAFEDWVRAGGGVVGLHSASATELDWPFFVELIGATFRTHPPMLLAADVTVEDATDPLVAGLPARWHRTDEWYSYTQRPEDAPDLHVVLAFDELSAGADLPADQRAGFHPIAWTHTRFGGRTFYTAMGHTPESYTEPAFLDLMAAAIRWTAGA